MKKNVITYRKKNRVTITIRIPENIRKWLKDNSEKNKISQSDIIIDALISKHNID